MPALVLLPGMDTARINTFAMEALRLRSSILRLLATCHALHKYIHQRHWQDWKPRQRWEPSAVCGMQRCAPVLPLDCSTETAVGQNLLEQNLHVMRSTNISAACTHLSMRGEMGCFAALSLSPCRNSSCGKAPHRHSGTPVRAATKRNGRR